MRFVHLSDLHLGKTVNEISMLDNGDQQYILDEIIGIVRTETPDGVIIAGDVYDRPVPPAEAVSLFDGFLTRLSECGAKVFVIGGNHDSAERIAFGRQFFAKSGIFLSPVYNGAVEPIAMEDSFGTVNVYMLPFIRPAHVRHIFPDESAETYTQAVGNAIAHMNVDVSRRNILVTHQFVTGSERSDSETVSVGGADNVDVDVFKPFDYVALGHIHKPQSVSRETVRYSGSPLKYSFSETGHEKSAAVVDIAEKGSVSVRTVPLKPLREMRVITGSFEDLKNYGSYKDDYIKAVLTDEYVIPEAFGILSENFPYLMKLEYERKSAYVPDTEAAAALPDKSGTEYFSELFMKIHGRPLNDDEMQAAADIFRLLAEERGYD